MVHKKCDETSFADNNYASIELFVLSFCFIEVVWISSSPMVNTPPVWMFISECTAKVELEYQYLMVTSLIFNARLISSVFLEIMDHY